MMPRAAMGRRSPVTARRFLVSCVHCLRVMMLVDRIADPELSRLRQHLLDCHPDTIVGPSPGIEATLRHFRVEPEPGPPDAT